MPLLRELSRITEIPQMRSREFPTLGAGWERRSDGVDRVAVAAHSVAVAGDGEDAGVVEESVEDGWTQRSIDRG